MKKFNLENEPKIKSGFYTPEDYFETLSERVLQQLPKEKPKTISIFSRRKNWFAAAAAVFVIGLSIPTYKALQSEPISDLDTASLENYIANHENVTDTDLVNLFDKKDIQKLEINLKIDTPTLEEALLEEANTELLD